MDGDRKSLWRYMYKQYIFKWEHLVPDQMSLPHSACKWHPEKLLCARACTISKHPFHWIITLINVYARSSNEQPNVMDLAIRNVKL